MSKKEPQPDRDSGYSNRTENTPRTLILGETNRGREGPPVGDSYSIGEFAETRSTHTAYNRFGQYTNEEFEQPHFRQACEPVPDESGFSSLGLYFVDEGQQYWLHDEEYEGTENHRIRTIQDQCENNNRTLYKVVAESDALETEEEEPDYTVSELVEQLRIFLKEWIEIIGLAWYYSGNRSIHVHTDWYVTEEQLGELKDLAEQFNEEMDGPNLDTSIYDPKSQFRLVGTKHRTTGLYKVPIEPDYTRQECVTAAMTPPEFERRSFHNIPTPFQHNDALDISPSNKYGSWSRSAISEIPADDGVPTSSTYYQSFSLSPPLSLINPSIVRRATVPVEFETRIIPWYLKEIGIEREISLWSKSDYQSPFSPYIGSGQGRRRSISVFRQREGYMITDTDGKGEKTTYLPVSAYQIVGAGDGRFTRSESNTLIELSPRDYEKYDGSKGDMLVMIAGWSHNSRFIDVSPKEAKEVSDVLEQDGRLATLDLLEDMGYEVGSRGRTKGNYEDLGGGSGETEAQRMKREIDAGELIPKYKEAFRVACRLLKIDGWDRAWAWLREYYGPAFNAENTYNRLSKPVKAYPEEYSHVRLPESAEAAKERFESPRPNVSDTGEMAPNSIES